LRLSPQARCRPSAAWRVGFIFKKEIMKRYILTGTPGAGKTTLVRALYDAGYSVVPEAATDVIAVKQSQGIAEPWKSAGFVDEIVRLQKQRQMEAATSPLQFHDRSAVCCYALARYLGQKPSAFLLAEMERLETENIFQRDVFFILNLGFCEPTAARRISFEESLAFEQLHIEVYRERGYRLVDIMPDTVAERMKKILQLSRR
jgi:predicted ATPase